MANYWNEYIDDDCLIQDENYLTFKPLMDCFICKKILKNPVMCSNCQSNFCKKCIENWSDEHSKCPNNCENSEYKTNQDKMALLSILKFKCKNCKSEVKYNDVKSHVDSGCGKLERESKLCEIIYKKKKLKKLTSEEVKKAKEKNEEINYITSKNNFLI